MGVVSDTDWMRRAYAQALRARDAGEVPVGAVIVSAEQQLLGEGYNQVLCLNDPTAHAEVVAIRHAAAHTHNYRLTGATLYVTLEPCCMCAGALIHARIERLVFATRDVRAGAAGSVFNLMQCQALNHAIRVDEGPLQQMSADLLTNFFKARRP